MATSLDLSSRVTEVVTCPICFEDFKDPRLLPCVHSFCLQCFQSYCKDKCPGDDVPCPVCRKEFHIPKKGVESLPHNFFLQNLVDAKTANHQSQTKQAETSSCEHCFKIGQNKTATVYCVDCNQKLCGGCSMSHTKRKDKSHDVRAIGDALSAELIWRRGSYCDKHSGRRLEWYCFDCKENVCMKCIEVHHKHHKYDAIEKVAKTFVASIQSITTHFPDRIFKFRERVTRDKLANEQFLKKADTIQVELQRKVKELKRLVDDHVATLMQELEEAKTSSVQETTSHVDDCELALTALESFHDYSSQLTSKGSACDITRATNDLRVRADELLNTYVSPADYRPPDIEFVATTTNVEQNIIGSLVTSTVPAETPPPPPVPARRKYAKTVHQQHEQSSRAEPSKQSPPVPDLRSQTESKNDQVESVRQQYLQSSPQVVGRFTEAECVCGVTLLNYELYVLLDHRDADQVDVYSTTDFTPLRHINVDELSFDMRDIASCVQKRCIYIADFDNKCVHRVGLDMSESKWPASGSPQSLSVTRSCNLLVTCWGENAKLVELSSEDGKLVREITLQSDIEWPRHSMQLSNNRYLVCHLHADYDEDNSGMSLVESVGRDIRSHSVDLGQISPCYMAVDDNGFIFVADDETEQILLFDPSLKYVRNVLQDVKHGPTRLCFDDVTRRLYVGELGTRRGGGIVSVVQM